jgi:ABC-type antimicrobial peptide transport system permease subunit
MFGSRLTKIIRDISARKVRTALVALSVFVGVLGVVVVSVMGQLVSRQLEKDIHANELAMLRVFVDLPANTPVDNAAVLRLLRDYPGVTAVEGQAVYEFQWKRPGEQDFRTGELYAYSEPFGQVTLEPVRLLSGAYPVDGQDEIAIEKRMADRYKLAVGDTITVRVDGTGERAMRVSGLIFQPYLYVGGGDGSTSAYATYSDAQQIVQFTGFSSFFARFTDWPTMRQESHAFRRLLNNQTPYEIVFYLLNDPDHNLFVVGVRQSARVLTILAVIALLVSSFVVTDVIGSVIAEQRKEIGAMKALGATRWDVLAIYLGMALTYGLLGTIPAIALGVPLGQHAAQLIAPAANAYLQDTSAPLSAVLLGSALGLVVPVLAAFVPTYNGTRVTILEAITDQGIRATYGRGPLPSLVRMLNLPPLLFQSVNNILQHKARLALSFVTLTLSVAAFMGILAVYDTLNGVVGSIESTFNYQMSFDPGSIEVMNLLRSVLTEEQIREIKPGVAIQLQAEQDDPSGAPASDGGTSQKNSRLVDLYVTALNTRTDLLNVVLQEGSGWQDNPDRPGIVITPRMAETFDKTVGDTLHLVAPENSGDFEIIGIAEFPIETAFMESQQLAAFVGTIRDAPIPNAYWEQVRVRVQDGLTDPFDGSPIWALGIDERVGTLLTADFNADKSGVIITKALADATGLAAGDDITLEPADTSLFENLIDGSTVTYPILKVTLIKAQDLRLVARQVPADLQTGGDPPVVAMYWPELASLVHLDYNAISPSTFYIDVANPTANNGNTGTLYKPSAVYHNEGAFEQRITQTISSMGFVTIITSILMAFVGGIGLLTVTSINVLERQREIGVMRSVGATSRTILSVFWAEGLLVGLAAWGVGLPLSLGLSKLLIATVPFSEVIVAHYRYYVPFAGLLGILVVTGIATVNPAIAAARKTVSEILRYQ